MYMNRMILNYIDTAISTIRKKVTSTNDSSLRIAGTQLCCLPNMIQLLWPQRQLSIPA